MKQQEKPLTAEQIKQLEAKKGKTDNEKLRVSINQKVQLIKSGKDIKK